MRRITKLALAMGIVVAAVAGCGIASKEDMANRLKNEAAALDSSNYLSTATMTVQMDNSSQTYYIETAYESPSIYRIKLGDANKNINQIIVRNESGMFIVSPSLQKVFRFNGNWAQNQGHIYLYDQILQQLAASKDLKQVKSGSDYTFEIPTATGNDVVTKEQVVLNSKSLDPKQVVLFDQKGRAVVTIKFLTFKQNMTFQTADFDPHKLINQSGATKTTLAGQTVDTGFIPPSDLLGDTLDLQAPEAMSDGFLLRYKGMHDFVLNQWRPDSQDQGIPNAKMVDLFGVPALFTNVNGDKEMIWMNDDREFALTSHQLSLGEMKQVAISTMGQVSK
jgi:outer membrane lipoprotein-sorting protein